MVENRALQQEALTIMCDAENEICVSVRWLCDVKHFSGMKLMFCQDPEVLGLNSGRVEL